MSTDRRRIGKYELHERLGRGGMAEVWKAFDPQLNRYVAIKFLHADLQADPDFLRRFEREARVIASLRHPNIIRIHDFRTTQSLESGGDLAYMIMAYVEGGQTLADYIRKTSRAGRFPSSTEIVRLFTSIGTAIDYAHQQGMIHRDIKPTNILLDQDNTARNRMGEPVLADFGIVKLLGASTGTLSGSWLGTPLYISPEQAKGHPGNERSDIYSLGVILYEICTGVRPFQGDSPVSIIMQHISAIPTPPALINPGIPPAFTEVILCALAKDPALRFPNASSMVSALAQALKPPASANSSTPVYSIGEMNRPAYHTPSSLSSPGATPPSLSLPAAQSIPPFQVPVGGGQLTPSTPTGSISKASIPTSSFSTTTERAFLQPPPMLAPPSVPKAKKRRRLFIALMALVILLIGSVGLSSLYLLSHGGSSSSIPQASGHAYFASSGPLGENTAQGLNDELLIDLQNIADPASGKSYYAWLLPDSFPNSRQNVVAPIALGKLSLDHSNVHLLYKNQQHNNLIGIISRFLITEETTNSTPSSPTSDHGAWRYYAELPQEPILSANGATVLDQLRDLLYESPSLQEQGISGGLSIHLLKNTQKVSQWATSAKDAWSNKNPVAIRQQVIRILYYLDGSSLVRQDVPNMPPLLDVDPTLAQVPLIRFEESQVAPDYVSEVDHALINILASTKTSPEMLRLANHLRDALFNINTWLLRVRQHAKQLFNMTDAELLQSSSQQILDDMEKQASYADNGQVTTSNQRQAGVEQIYSDIQHLAVFDVKPCTATSCG